MTERVFDFLNTTTPAKLVEKETGKEITNLKNIYANTGFERGRFGSTPFSMTNGSAL